MKPAFYCVHSISGAAGSDFLALAAQLDPDVRFFGVQAPPRRFRDPDFGSSVTAIADAYATALIRFQPTGPFLIGGWSAGGPIALEMAHSLISRRREVALLVAIDGVLENTAIDHQGLDLVDVAHLIGGVPGWIAEIFMMRNTVLASLSRAVKALFDPKRFSGAQDHRSRVFANLGLFPSPHGQFMVRLYDAILEYRPSPYDGETVAYEAKVVRPIDPPRYGKKWKSIAPKAKIVRINGNHRSIMKSPHVLSFATDLRERIARFELT